jgi:hypothetical protein
MKPIGCRVGKAKRAHLGVTAWARREERAFAHPTKSPNMIRNSKSLYSLAICKAVYLPASMKPAASSVRRTTAASRRRMTCQDAGLSGDPSFNDCQTFRANHSRPFAYWHLDRDIRVGHEAERSINHPAPEIVMENVITIGRRHVPIGQIASVEPFEPSATRRAFKASRRIRAIWPTPDKLLRTSGHGFCLRGTD